MVIISNSLEYINNMENITVIIPAKNEAASLKLLLPEIKKQCPYADILVVNDGSTDDTSKVCEQFGVMEIVHQYPKGNGAAIKSGARLAKGEVLVFMDGDGQHSPEDIPRLMERLEKGADMVVGARQRGSQASIGRGFANGLYNRLASYMTGHPVKDLTSGFRAVWANKFRKFLYLLPNGFSYPTTSTMAFFRAGYEVAYIPINAARREGVSHIRPIRDGVRFLLIIFKIGTLYSPLKLFFPVSFAILVLGVGYYGFTFFSMGRFTNMSALMISTSLIIFLVGLVSEQITALMYKDSEGDD